MIKKIGFDIDGVLQDYQVYRVEKFLEHYLEVTGHKYDGRIDFTKYDTNAMFPDCRDKKLIEDSGKNSIVEYMSGSLSPIEPFVKDLFVALKKLKVEIYIITARYRETEEEMRQLEQATRERFERERIPVDEFYIGIEDKVNIIKSVGIDVMVEDSVENILKISELIPVIAIQRPYNMLVRGANIYQRNTLYPDDFIATLKYIENHRNYLGMPNNYNADDSSLNVEFVGERAYVNVGQLANTNLPLFIVPMSGRSEKTLLNKWCAYFHGSNEPDTVVDLYEVDKPVEEISNSITKRIVQKYNPKQIDLQVTNDIDSDTYQLRCEIIYEIIKETLGSRKRHIIFGPQLMSLKRDYIQEVSKCPFLFPHITDAQKEIITESIYKKDYDVALLIEDLDEVSMNIRKFKIIAGTDPEHLDGYVNREYFSSDGIDSVELREGESPYNPENLKAALSPDTYVIADLHLSPKDKEKTDMIIRNINYTVGKNDTLLFLGDFDGKGGASKELIAETLKKFTCKNIYMLVGNNDGYTIKDYISMGFLGIDDCVTFEESPNRNIVLSHCPMRVDRDDINIHGHIHGSRVYWNMSYENHYDVWTEDFIPIRIKDCITALENNWQRASSINVSYV